MTVGFVETSAASASGSIVAYALMRLLRGLRDKTKVRGLLLIKGKTFAEANFSNEDVIFYDLDGHLDVVNSLSEMPVHDVRLKLFPEARKQLKVLKNNFRNKTIVLCSSSHELLKYLKVKDVFAILPSSRMMSECVAPVQALVDANKNRASQLASLDKLNVSLSVKMDNKHYIAETWEDQTKKIREHYHVSVRIF